MTAHGKREQRSSLNEAASNMRTHESLFDASSARAPDRVSATSIAFVIALSSCVSRWLHSTPPAASDARLRTTSSPPKPPATCSPRVRAESRKVTPTHRDAAPLLARRR